MKKAAPAVCRPAAFQILRENFLNKSKLKPDWDSAIVSLQPRWSWKEKKSPTSVQFVEQSLRENPFCGKGTAAAGLSMTEHSSGGFSLLRAMQPWHHWGFKRPSSLKRPGWETSREQRGSICACLQPGSSSVTAPSGAGVFVVGDDSSGWWGCHHSNFHQELTMHPNQLPAKLTYCMSPVRNDCSEVIFCTNM